MMGNYNAIHVNIKGPKSGAKKREIEQKAKNSGLSVSEYMMNAYEHYVGSEPKPEGLAADSTAPGGTE